MINMKFRRRPPCCYTLCRALRTLCMLITAACCTATVAFQNSVLYGDGLFWRGPSGSWRNVGAPPYKFHRIKALNYKDLPDDATQDASSSSITDALCSRTKRTKLKPSKRKSRKRFLTTSDSKRPTTQEDLARHVQSVFSDDILRMMDEEMLLDSNLDVNGGDDETNKKLERHPSLVLNADYQPLRMLPLSIWSWQDTVKAVLGGKAVVVEVYPDVVIRAVSINMPVPSVIALREYAPTGKTKPAFTRRNVFLRDGYRCQYCNGLFRTSDLSLDHVEPRCHGGKLTWENTVTSCRQCNGRKGCLRPAQIHTVGMSLKTKPRCPSLYELAAEANKFVPRRVHPSWAPFLGIDAKHDNMRSQRNGSSLPRP
ncbi:hypothetical protein HJC23_000221 [Cyclotella cryptica]|uniref:C2H2-type domain-containing protein n=1 Tax=Cyclotella cryptica TaxID=29204 RepID=A0ABD3PLP1_9STRA